MENEFTDDELRLMVERAQTHVAVTTAASTKMLFKNPTFLDATESVCNDVLALVSEIKKLRGKKPKKAKSEEV